MSHQQKILCGTCGANISAPGNEDLTIPEFLKTPPTSDHEPISEVDFADELLPEPVSGKQE